MLPRTTSPRSSFRQRLALLLTLAVLINCLAPAAFPSMQSALAESDKKGSAAATADAATDFVTQVPLTVNDITYSPVTKKLYASVPSSVGANGNSITTIDPATATIGSSVFIGSEPSKMAMSDDGQTLYASLDGAYAIRRFNVATQTPDQQFSFGQDTFNGRYRINDLAVAPGNPNLLAVVRYYPGTSPPEAGVAVFDNGVQRAKTGPGHVEGSDFIAFSASASKLYGGGYTYGLRTMTIDSTGVTVNSKTSFDVGARIKFDNGLVFSSSGQVINPDTQTLLGTFAGASSPAYQSAFVPDSTAGRAYYVVRDTSNNTLSLKAFDIKTFLPAGSLALTGISGDPVSLVRWGANGLALTTSANKLYLIQTSLIPSAEPIPTPTPVVNPTPTPTPTPAPATFVRKVSLETTDLIYNESSQSLYASVPSTAGAGGNSVTPIDPVTGTIGSSVFIGSEPVRLAQTDDGQTLYVGLDGASAVRSFDVPTKTAGAQFPIGIHPSYGPYAMSDIAVAPGNPKLVAVARQLRGTSPSEAGVAVFDNGVQRTGTGPGHIAGSDFLTFSASASTLYGAGYDSGLSTLTVDASGVTVARTVSFSTGRGMQFVNGLLYGTNGQVINPDTGALVGTFNVLPSQFGFSSFSPLVAVDAAHGKVFFLVSGTTSGSAQLRAYDINTFLLVGAVTITGVSGTPTSFVRWGANGVAFRTDSKSVYVVQTALIDDAAPVPQATPSPTPSPTPTPTPVIIPTFVRQVNLPANDLIYNQSDKRLYASVPSIAGAGGNSITPLTPETGAVGTAVFVGSEPGRLALADDNQTLYVSLTGANAIRRFDTSTQTPGAQFIPSSAFQNPQDMDVVPGSPQSIALTGKSGDGIAIYDNGVQRTKIGNGNFVSIVRTEFASPTKLYGGSGSSDLVNLSADATGITTTSMTRLLFLNLGSEMKLANGLLYSAGGRVVDPEAKTLAGTFQGIGFGASGMAVDTSLGRIFFVATNSSNNSAVISAYDLNTFLPIGSVTIPNVSGTPTSLVRWGTNGLAFRTASNFSFPPNTFTGQIYLIQTALVSTSTALPTGVAFALANNNVSEANQPASINIIRSGDTTGTTTVDYATSDGTATAGSDYTATSGTLTFAPGETTKTITVPIKDDSVFEGSEAFTVTLSNVTGTGGLVPPSTTTVTIQDNESTPSLQVLSRTVSEPDTGTETVAVEVRLTNPTTKTVTVNYATSDGTARAGSDYVAASGTLTFNPLETSKTVSININADDVTETTETFSLSLSSAVNANNFNGPGTISIIDASIVFLGLSDSGYTVNEADPSGVVAITVNRSGNNSAAVSVDYATSDQAGSVPCQFNTNSLASERCDYARVVGTLRFAAGEKTKTILIPIINDAHVEPTEFFSISLRNAQGATLGTSLANVILVDNDTQTATTNPIEDQSFLIRQQYVDFLGRVAEPDGFNFWMDRMSHCPAGQVCDRIDTSMRFFQSDEFQERGFYVYRLYDASLGRLPRYAEFVADVARLNGSQTPAEQRLGKDAYLLSLVNSIAFRNLYAPYLSADGLTATDAAGFVNALCTRAGITPASKQTLIDNLQSKAKDPAHTLEDFILTPEISAVGTKFYDRGFITMQYFGYLRRDPDLAGFNFWVGQLIGENAPHKQDYRFMVGGFLQSDEFHFRFALIPAP
jgi:sugar lactone lactonase YvrE